MEEKMLQTEENKTARLWLGLFGLNFSVLGIILFLSDLQIASLSCLVFSVLFLVLSFFKMKYYQQIYIPLTYICVLLVNVFNQGGVGGMFLHLLTIAYCFLNISPDEKLKYTVFGAVSCLADLIYSFNFGLILEAALASFLLALSQAIGYAGYHIADLSRKISKLRRQEEKSQSLQTLLGVFCHDLSTPMMAISLICYQKRHDKDLKEQDSAAWDEVHKLIERERYLIENIRKVEQVASGFAETLEISSTDPIEVFGKIDEIFGKRCASKGLKLIQNVEKNQEILCLADKNILIYNVLSNLMTNAIKFSERGQSITLGVFRKIDMVTLYVKDEGVGMSQRELENLMSGNHARNSKLGTENEKGTGLGIKIVKNFVEIMGGNFKIKSRCKDQFPRDHGTSFEITFRAVTSKEVKNVA